MGGESGGFRRVVPAVGNGAPGRTGIADVSVPKVAPLPVQSVTAAHVLSKPDPAAPASLWQWLGRQPGPTVQLRRGVRFTLPCVIAISIAARLAGARLVHRGRGVGGEPPAAGAQGAGLPAAQAGRVRVAPSEKTIRRVARLIDHDLADDLLCGHAAELAAAGEARPRRSCRNSAATRPARPEPGPARPGTGHARPPGGSGQPAADRKSRHARPPGRPAEGRRGRGRGQRGAIAGGARQAPGRRSAFGRVPVPAGHPVFPAAAYGDPRHVPALRGLGADGKASRGARVKEQEAPQHLGFFWHGTRLNAAQRAVDRKNERDHRHRPGHRRDGPGRACA